MSKTTRILGLCAVTFFVIIVGRLFGFSDDAALAGAIIGAGNWLVLTS